MLEVPRYARSFFDPASRLTRIGDGELGGKARGLVRARDVLAGHAPAPGSGFELDVPALVVLATGFFERFVESNGLGSLLEDGADDRHVADAFHAAPIPAELVGDLRALAAEVRVPLAVRSSSALEDALGQPFAGVYGTKMIPGDQPDPESRFRALVDAVKFVWASTWFDEARSYLAATTHRGERERMAVIVQEVVGERHGERYYPEISGVARSIGFYPVGGSRPEEGVGHLALGLGKTIVDGGVCWTFSPTRPRATAPFASARERMKATQTEFWSVRVGSAPPYDPMSEAEFLVRAGLGEAESDGALGLLASTYDPAADRLWPGVGRPGARVLDFAPVLVGGELPLAETVRFLLSACEDELGAPVEIEFALSLHPRRTARFGFLQVRPLFVSAEVVDLDAGERAAGRVVVVSEPALGNGRRRLEDAVYVVPERFDPAATPQIALELESLNRSLLEQGRHCLLIGFGRWGSSDPWLGIPVRWDQISSAGAIVEASLPGMSKEPSQGSHFFHNLSSFAVLYLTVPASEEDAVDWALLAAQPEVAATEHLRHVRFSPPLEVAVDGRTRRGVVRLSEGS
jgi:hypothetical protein